MARPSAAWMRRLGLIALAATFAGSGWTTLRILSQTVPIGTKSTLPYYFERVSYKPPPDLNAATVALPPLALTTSPPSLVEVQDPIEVEIRSQDKQILAFTGEAVPATSFQDAALLILSVTDPRSEADRNHRAGAGGMVVRKDGTFSYRLELKPTLPPGKYRWTLRYAGNRRDLGELWDIATGDLVVRELKSTRHEP